MWIYFYFLNHFLKIIPKCDKTRRGRQVECQKVTTTRRQVNLTCQGAVVSSCDHWVANSVIIKLIDFHVCTSWEGNLTRNGMYEEYERKKWLSPRKSGQSSFMTSQPTKEVQRMNEGESGPGPSSSAVEFENVLIGKWQIRLPSLICTDPNIFQNIFSAQTWNQVLTAEQRLRITVMSFPSFEVKGGHGCT